MKVMNESDDQMQDFVNSYMTSMLGPVIEDMHELRNYVQGIGGKLMQTMDLTTKHTNTLKEQANELSTQGAALATQDQQLKTTHQLLLATRADNADLRSKNETIRASLDKSDGKLMNTGSAVQALQQAQEATRADLRKLRNEFNAADKKALDIVEQRLNNMNMFCRELHDSQRNLQDMLQSVKFAEEELQTNLKLLSSHVEEGQQESLDKLTSTISRVNSLETKLNTCQQDVHGSAVIMKSLDSQIQTMKSQVATIEAKDAQGKILDILETNKEFARKLGAAEEDLIQMRRKTAEQIHARDKLLRKLDDKSMQNGNDIIELEKGWKDHDERLRQHDKTLKSLMPPKQEGEDDDEPSSPVNFDAEIKELRALTNAQREALSDCNHRLEGLTQAHDSLKAKQGRDKERANDDINGLQGEVSDAFKWLNKLDGRAETMAKYFQGFGRGLQDAHNHITGDSGATAPRSAALTPRGGLPALPSGHGKGSKTNRQGPSTPIPVLPSTPR
jgi:chromosome segregation ATPase